MHKMKINLFILLLIGATLGKKKQQKGEGAHRRVTRWAPYSSPPEGHCPDLQYELNKATVVLKNLEVGFLDDMCGNTENRVIVTSQGESAIKQPTRFGLFFLHGWNEHETDGSNRYPSFYRPASGQYLFFMKEIGTWDYWHTYDRWVVGPEHNKAVGGLMIKPYDPTVVCPYSIKWFRTHRWYHDTYQHNIWNPVGNPWKIDDTIKIEVYDEEAWPEFDCGCSRIRLSQPPASRVSEYHPSTLGLYVKQEGTAKDGYLAPMYKKEEDENGPAAFLYSHHPRGKVWLVGSSTATWSLRLSKLDGLPGEEENTSCPLSWEEGREWEYLQSRKGDKEVWLRDKDLEITCEE